MVYTNEVKALIVYVVRILLVLGAIPLGVRIALVPFGSGVDSGLAALPLMPVCVGLLVLLAVAVNLYILRPVQPQPPWLRSRTIRAELTVFIVMAFVAALWFG